MSADFSIATIEWGAESITLLDLMKDILGITDNAQDIELAMFLQMAGESCEKYIDNKIASQEVTERWTHARTQAALRYYPVSSVTAVLVDGTDETGDYSQFDGEGVNWIVGDNSKCCMTVSSCFESLAITYTAGYDPIPADLGHAVVIAGISYQSQRGAVSGAVKKESVVGVASIEYSTSDDTSSGAGLLPAGAVATLDQYRRYSV